MAFVLAAIREHQASELYKVAHDAKNYATGRNTTITNYQKVLYTISGKAVPDNWTANHKCVSNFFRRFVTQETAFLLGNGVDFQKATTKKALGKSFDSVVYQCAKSALIQSVSFGFFNNDHVEMFELLEFVPFYDEENGALRAGVRFWQVDKTKPLRATLYEEDGYTEYISHTSGNFEVLKQKRTYKRMIERTGFDGETVYDGGNYSNFPIVPLFANSEKQSILVGLRAQIDCYDLIKSGFANDLDDASMIYWTLENCGGMDDIDLVKFVQRMRTIKASVVDGDDGARAESHTIDVPYQSREAYLERLRNDLYEDAMALDVKSIAAGNVTATQIRAAYEPLNEKTDEFEFYVINFINSILDLAGVDDVPRFVRSAIANQGEDMQTLLSVADYLPSDYIAQKAIMLLGDVDRTEELLKEKAAEEVERFVSAEGL